VERPEAYLHPAPEIVPHGEPLPAFGPLSDQAGPPIESDIAEDWEPVEIFPAEQAEAEDLLPRAEGVALADERVKTQLAGKRSIAIGASLLDDKNGGSQRVVQVFYDYTDNVAVELFVDPSTEAVQDIEMGSWQPAPVQEEIERAIALAREDPRLADRLTEDLEGTALLLTTEDPEDPNHGHRQLDVRFVRPDERLPRYMARVDLSTESVSVAGAVSGSEPEREGGEQ